MLHQLFGRAAWEAADTGEITLESARRGVAAGSREIERFYAERCDAAWERGAGAALSPLAGCLSERGGCAGGLEFRSFSSTGSRETASRC